jgi:hypothetical protein
MDERQPMNIFLIVDESGSMSGLKQETISGFNKFLKEQQALGKTDAAGKRVKPARLHVTLFDSLHVRKPIWDAPIEDVKPWTNEDYNPGASTPLLDAVGDTLTAATGKKALVVIITDGQENASGHWTKAAVKELIEKKQRDGWTVIYLGANVDAFSEAGAMGVRSASTSGYNPTAIGTQMAYDAVSGAASMSRSGIGYTLTNTAGGDPMVVPDPTPTSVPGAVSGTATPGRAPKSVTAP